MVKYLCAYNRQIIWFSIFSGKWKQDKLELLADLKKFLTQRVLFSFSNQNAINENAVRSYSQQQMHCVVYGCRPAKKAAEKTIG